MHTTIGSASCLCSTTQPLEMIYHDHFVCGPLMWCVQVYIRTFVHVFAQVLAVVVLGEVMPPPFTPSLPFSFDSHFNRTAQYHHPSHSKPPPPYSHAHTPQGGQEDDRRQKLPSRSLSHRSTEFYRVDHPTSAPRRSKSLKDDVKNKIAPGGSLHTRQLSTMTFIPPNPHHAAGRDGGEGGWIRLFMSCRC